MYVFSWLGLLGLAQEHGQARFYRRIMLWTKCCWIWLTTTRSGICMFSDLLVDLMHCNWLKQPFQEHFYGYVFEYSVSKKTLDMFWPTQQFPWTFHGTCSWDCLTNPFLRFFLGHVLGNGWRKIQGTLWNIFLEMATGTMGIDQDLAALYTGCGIQAS